MCWCRILLVCRCEQNRFSNPSSTLRPPGLCAPTLVDLANEHLRSSFASFVYCIHGLVWHFKSHMSQHTWTNGRCSYCPIPFSIAFTFCHKCYLFLELNLDKWKVKLLKNPYFESTLHFHELNAPSISYPILENLVLSSFCRTSLFLIL